MTARTAGLLYFVNGAAGFFSYMIVPKKLLVPNYAQAVNLVTVAYVVLGAAGEGLTQLWLLIKGVKVQLSTRSSVD